MIKIKSDYIAYTIVFSLIFIFPLLSSAQIIADQKPLTIASAEITKQSIKKENNSVIEEDEVDTPQKGNKLFNFNSDHSPDKQNRTEDKQDMMEKALDLLEVADKLWANGKHIKYFR